MSENSYFSPPTLGDRTANANRAQAVAGTPDSREPRCRNWEDTPDLRSDCPICGYPYTRGDEVVMLDSLVLGDVPPLAVSGSPVFLGHHRCVLPRLLTLLASFQPANRFDQATHDLLEREAEIPAQASL